MRASYDPRVTESDGVNNYGFYQDHLVDDGIKPKNAMVPGQPPLAVARPLYQQEELNKEMQYSVPERQVAREALNSMKEWSVKRCLKSVFPIMSWLPQYPWKRDIESDLVAGFTVGVMHIPQGMGYALLANVPPIVGLYMAFFPVLVYVLLGTSKHNSMGTFAVVTLMTGKIVLKYSTDEVGPVEVGTTACFIVGIMQLIMYLGRMGAMSYLLSDTLVSGFTTGAAIHVFTSQVKELLGVTIPPHVGNYEVISTYMNAFKNIAHANWAAIVISIISITILMLNNELLKPIVAKRTNVPIPIQLILVIIWTLISKYVDLQGTYSVKIIAHIPKGLPEPNGHDASLIQKLLIDSFPVAVVSYAVSVSMGLIFAQKENYEIDFNQELLAMGASNLFGSFFSCLPFSASLSRSSVQYMAGGKSQITSIISCSILACVLLWIGPFFEPLPRCVLAAIIVVALKGLLMQVTHFPRFLRLSTMDGIVWMGTFLTVVVVSIDIGLLVGMILSICSIFFRGMKPYTCLMENVPNTDLYLDVNRYKGTMDIPEVKIFHFCGSLNFATRAGFKTSLCEALKLNLTKQLKYSKRKGYKKPFDYQFLVLDFTALSNIDPSAATALKALIAEFGKLSVKVLVAGSSSPVYEMLVRCQLVGSAETECCKLFPTVHDAVLWAIQNATNDSVNLGVVETPEQA